MPPTARQETLPSDHRSGLGRLASIGLGLALALRPDSLWACAACFGKSDSALAAGLNWGILSLLAVVLAVLGGIAAFFVQVARRGALTDEPSTPPATSEIPQQNP